MIKIAVWLSGGLEPVAGGGYSYSEQLISIIDQHDFPKDVEVVFTGLLPKPASQKKKYYQLFESSNLLWYRAARVLTKWLPGIGSSLNDFFLKLQLAKRDAALIAWLKKKDVDAIFYPTQMHCEIDNFPFIASNWDIGHKSIYAFPEVSMNGIFEKRERFYNLVLPKALHVFVESDAGKEELAHYTGINADKIKTVPLFAGGLINEKINEPEANKLLASHQLKAKEYYFYPAQFWPSKNHYGLLQAFKQVKQKYPQLKLVLTGADKGNLAYIKGKVREAGLEDSVVIPGFVTNAEISYFYRNALALIMPTFLGPTNMPLLEALALQCPIICSDHAGHREMVMDAALYFNPLNHADMAICMEQILVHETRDALLAKGQEVLKGNTFTIDNAIKSLEKHFVDLANVRACWGQYDDIQ